MGRIMWRRVKIILLITLVVNVVGCAVKQPASRYHMRHDRAPEQSVDISAIPPVIPIVEPRTAAGNKNPYTVNGKTYHVLDTELGYRETGVASWYGKKFHGFLTSNGEVYDMFALTAAHKSLPIPSYIKVTNLDNQRSLVVRINDRGPFHGARIVDLSYAAAMKLGYADKGTARVSIEAITPAKKQRYLQIGAFANLQTAEQLQHKTQQLIGMPVFISSTEGEDSLHLLHRVRIGPISRETDVVALKQRVVDSHLGSPYLVD